MYKSKIIKHKSKIQYSRFVFLKVRKILWNILFVTKHN